MIDSVFQNESERLAAFPVSAESIFLGHAGVTALPRSVADAVIDYTAQSATRHQEFGEVLKRITRARKTCADLIGASSDEIALLGPTSLGLSLFANGLEWAEGDEVVCYRDDYPANVYPWQNLARHGVNVRYLHPEEPGAITPELVHSALTPRTRLVALASCHFLSGFRIDIDAIGKTVHDAGALFSLDAIQTLGAFPTRVDHVDFLSADSHKWLLGPLTAGIVYVKKSHFEKLRPSLLGAWNVISPNFVAQSEITFPDTAQRYEPGVLNVAGIFGMVAAIEMLQSVGIENVAARILELKAQIVAGVESLGFSIHGPREGMHASGITTLHHPEVPTGKIAAALEANSIAASHRHDRSGREFIRLSPHFYNTPAEIERVIEVLSTTIRS